MDHMPGPIRIQLLGPVRASSAERPIGLRGKTARTVLARLALSSGSVVGVDQLADALWDDDPPLHPSVSVRSIISRLRTQLGRGTIVTDGDGYRLDMTIVEVDLVEVERVLRQLEHDDPDPDVLARTLGLWSGEALTDVAWTPAFEPERARIQELRARLTDCRHEAMIRTGRVEETLADLERDAAAAPLRESRQLLLMRALDACGRTAEALRAGDDYRHRLVEETGLDPSPDYDDTARGLLASPAPSTAARPAVRRSWIPPDTPFVGREDELARLEELASERRLVTITGPGGVGKTRLVTEYMSMHTDRWDGSVDMVSLAPLDRDAPVDIALAASLGVEVSSAEVVGALTDWLSSRTSVLVIDNCEHVLSRCRPLVEQLLRDVADLRIITTSRRRLGLADEAILEVGPLGVSDLDAGESAPVKLFLDRIERTAPSLTMSDDSLDVVVDICRLVDGLPLALELAAARVTMFGLDVLRRRLLDGLAVPGLQTTDDDRRQATIESTVEWSLDLLTRDARELFDELSVFPSWFDLEALEHISCSTSVVDVFSEVLDSSLVVVDHQRPAYRLLEPIRQTVRRQLRNEKRNEITYRYLDWVASIVETIERCWITDDRRAAQELIEDHRADLRLTLTHFIEHGDAERHGRYANVLARALVDRTDIEIVELCRVDAGPSLEGALARCMLAWHQGDVEKSAQIADEIGRLIGDEHDLWGYYNWVQTPVHLYKGDADAVAESASRAIEAEQSYAFMRSESVALWALALLYNGRRTDAAEILERHEHLLAESSCGGFVAYTRAEVIAEIDPQLAIDHLSVSSEEASAAKASFSLRLTEVSRLVLLISSERTDDAARLALRLIPDLLRAGTYPQAWTAMRHIARLLGDIGEPGLGLDVLDSAAAAAAAPAVVGDAITSEQQLRAELVAASAGSTKDTVPLSLAEQWAPVRAVLERAIDL